MARELVAEDSALDLAVIKIDAPADKFKPVRLGDSGEVKPAIRWPPSDRPAGSRMVDRSSENLRTPGLSFTI